MRLPHRDQENNLTVKLAAKYSSQHVVGLDLAGPEGPIPNKAFSSFFEDAKEMHVPLQFTQEKQLALNQCKKH